jgi:hypothetical protein
MVVVMAWVSVWVQGWVSCCHVFVDSMFWTFFDVGLNLLSFCALSFSFCVGLSCLSVACGAGLSSTSGNRSH